MPSPAIFQEKHLIIIGATCDDTAHQEVMDLIQGGRYWNAATVNVVIPFLGYSTMEAGQTPPPPPPPPVYPRNSQGHYQNQADFQGQTSFRRICGSALGGGAARPCRRDHDQTRLDGLAGSGKDQEHATRRFRLGLSRLWVLQTGCKVLQVCSAVLIRLRIKTDMIPTRQL